MRLDGRLLGRFARLGKIPVVHRDFACRLLPFARGVALDGLPPFADLADHLYLLSHHLAFDNRNFLCCDYACFEKGAGEKGKPYRRERRSRLTEKVN